MRTPPAAAAAADAPSGSTAAMIMSEEEEVADEICWWRGGRCTHSRPCKSTESASSTANQSDCEPRKKRVAAEASVCVRTEQNGSPLSLSSRMILASAAAEAQLKE